MAGYELYDIRDERFGALIAGSAVLEELYTGCRWAEGPVWFSDLNCLIWSDIPNERMMRWVPDGTVSVFRSPSNYVNGNTRDRQGRLVSCEHGGRRVTRTEKDGSITVLADRRTIMAGGSDAAWQLEEVVAAAGARLVLADVASADGSPRHDPRLLADAYEQVMGEA